MKRKRAIGAELVDGAVHFRVWAPARKSVAVELEGCETPLQAENEGYFSGFVEGAGAGSLYRFRLDKGQDLFPDPASRFQPQGVHGPSAVVDPTTFVWQHKPPEMSRKGQVIYEMHVGTFSSEGTWRGAAGKLPWLAQMGMTLLEVMPVHEFPGAFGWGYDGVDLWAPYHHYGTPDDFRSFVDAAHAQGLGVILDVVYNHLGPDGNYLTQYSPDYFTDRYPNDWGQSINFDGENQKSVREFFVENAAYWVDEFRLDGLRLDATQSIIDLSGKHILREIGQAAREASKGRKIFIVAENEPQESRLMGSIEAGGYGLDAMWNDDFHHTAFVRLTGHNPAYYTDYLGTPQEFLSALKWGFLYQGQRYKWQKQPRGMPSLGFAAEQFVWFIENHDQVANSAFGERLPQVTSPSLRRAMTALLLLSPATPMLFQGQEFGSPEPFLYFADHKKELAGAVALGRGGFLDQFPPLATTEMQKLVEPPHDRETFIRCKLDWNQRERNHTIVALHRDLLELRKNDPLIRRQRSDLLDGAVLGAEAFVIRFFAARPGDQRGGSDQGDRLLLVNFGRDLRLDPAPEPLLAPPVGRRWEVLWSSESPHYGGGGTPAIYSEENWFLPGQSTVLLAGVVEGQQS